MSPTKGSWVGKGFIFFRVTSWLIMLFSMLYFKAPSQHSCITALRRQSQLPRLSLCCQSSPKPRPHEKKKAAHARHLPRHLPSMQSSRCVALESARHLWCFFWALRGGLVCTICGLRCVPVKWQWNRNAEEQKSHPWSQLNIWIWQVTYHWQPALVTNLAPISVILLILLVKNLSKNRKESSFMVKNVFLLLCFLGQSFCDR